MGLTMNLFEELPDERIPEIIEPETIDISAHKRERKPKASYEEMFDSLPRFLFYELRFRGSFTERTFISCCKVIHAFQICGMENKLRAGSLCSDGNNLMCGCSVPGMTDCLPSSFISTIQQGMAMLLRSSFRETHPALTSMQMVMPDAARPEET